MFFRHNFHQRVVQNLDLVVSLIMKHIADNVPEGSVGVGARQESLRCFQVCMLFERGHTHYNPCCLLYDADRLGMGILLASSLRR